MYIRVRWYIYPSKTGDIHGFVQVGPKKCILPVAYTKHAKKLHDIQARADDIFVCGHPRTGTTLIQEMVWLLAYDLDYERARRESLLKRSVRFEYRKII